MQTPAPTPSGDAQAAPASITTVAADGKTVTLTIPRTQAEIEQLLLQRRELNQQLNIVVARRTRLSSEIAQTPEGLNRTGLSDHLRILDNRVVQLETDLASTERQLSLAPGELSRFTIQADNSHGDDFETGATVGSVITGVILMAVFLYRRRRWKRKAPALTEPTASDGRLERLERGMEAIAIEIERVSEGQRFVTRLLSESRQPASEPPRIAERAPVARLTPV
jgi:hypothetical protein